jgi:C4-dicarboxylate-specific signal transduction histidine kinase
MRSSLAFVALEAWRPLHALLRTQRVVNVVTEAHTQMPPAVHISESHWWHLTQLVVRWRATLLCYLFPILSVLVIFGIADYFEFSRQHAPYLLLLLGVVVATSAWYGGILSGWISVALATVTVDYFVIVPRRVVNFDEKALLWSVAFLTLAIASNVLSLHRRRIEQQLRRSRDALETRVAERTAELESAYDALKRKTRDHLEAEQSQHLLRRELARAARVTTLGVLSASIAHEVNQPLAAILSNGHAARNWLQKDPPRLDRAKDSVEAVIAAADRTIAVVGGIRRLIENRTPIFELVNLSDVVRQILTLVRYELQSRDIECKTEFESELPPVRASSVTLSQVVLNLIINGIDALEDVSRRPKELTIRVSSIGDEQVAITVEDSGKGIADIDLDRIFTPFYTTKPNGIGVGLSICRSVAEMYGGRIEATRRHPHGMSFSLILPISEDDP